MPKFYSNLSVALRYPVRLGSMYPNIQESSALCVLEPFGFIVITLKNLFGLSRCRKKKMHVIISVHFACLKFSGPGAQKIFCTIIQIF